MKLAGVVYLFETPQDSQQPMSESNRRDCEIFQKLCGDEALSMVVVGTTKWECVLNDSVAGDREPKLNTFWEGPNKQSEVYRFQNTKDGAWAIINYLAQEGVGFTILQIQRELVDYGKIIDDTDAGKHMYGAHELSKRRRRGKFSLARRILMFFGVDVSNLDLPFYSFNHRSASGFIRISFFSTCASVSRLKQPEKASSG